MLPFTLQKAPKLSGALGSTIGKETHLLTAFPELEWQVNSGGPHRPEQTSLACPWPWLPGNPCSVSQAGLTTTDHSSWPRVKSLCLCVSTRSSALYPGLFQVEAPRLGSGCFLALAFLASLVAVLGALHHLPPHVWMPLLPQAVFCSFSLSFACSGVWATGNPLTRANPPSQAGKSSGQPS